MRPDWRACGESSIAGSSSVYGDRTDAGSEARRPISPTPVSPYAAAKLAGELYCQAFQATYGLETVIVRYFNVFGPRQDPQSEYAAVIPKFVMMMLAGQRPMIFGDGKQSRDFTYVANVVQGNLLAAEVPDGRRADVQRRLRRKARSARPGCRDQSRAGHEDRADLRSAPRGRRPRQPRRYFARSRGPRLRARNRFRRRPAPLDRVLPPVSREEMTQASTLVALATYNEIENLPRSRGRNLYRSTRRGYSCRRRQFSRRHRPLVRRASGAEPRLRCLHRDSKRGLGSATIEAMRFAVDRGYEKLVTMDSDLSHDPAHLPSLIEASERADVVIGSRYCQGGAIVGWPLHRRLASRLLNGLSRTMLHLPVRDSSGSYRVYKVSRLRDIDLTAIQSGGYAYLEEILWHLHRAGTTFAEVPITFRDRLAGRSKNGLPVILDKLHTLNRLRRSC